MTLPRSQALYDFFTAFGSHPSLLEISARWQGMIAGESGSTDTTSLIELIDQATLFLEQEMHRHAYPPVLLDLHRQLFQDMESLIGELGNDVRHRFIVVIPVADRPQQIQSCLESLLDLCRRFAYGGQVEGSYRKLVVVIADDSKDPDSRARIKQMEARFTARGLETLYFGPQQQLQQLAELNSGQREALAGIVGNYPVEAFHHKGASITRNISYLKLKQLIDDDEHTLIWFIDSDQEFRINTRSQHGEIYAINYFHRLDRIFSNSGTLVLTGKVVGDPPVSPAVMAANLFQDLLGFLGDIAEQGPDSGCPFHRQPQIGGGDAVYHDMADLFGFQPPDGAFRYHCRLQGEHDQQACLNDFSLILNRFFDGEHPTRQIHYECTASAEQLTPARTLYTGNYVIRPQALNYFIPFAGLKLRMAGPQLGRIMQAELGDRFVSANLPLMHRRTHEATGESEFRAGVDKAQSGIDISGEFERQFFGDLMLFTLQGLIVAGYPLHQLSDEQIQEVLDDTESDMLNRYREKHKEIMAKLERFQQRFEDQRHWWWQSRDAIGAVDNFRCFIDNMVHNFGNQSPGYALIESPQHRQRRRQAILQALRSYAQDRANWQLALAQAS
ncbi:MAG: glycosyltransferase family A protein [Candidatus Thiodiazotropha sp.]